MAVLLQYTWQASSLGRGGSITTVHVADILSSHGGGSTTVHLADILSSQGWHYYYSTRGRHPL